MFTIMNKMPTYGLTLDAGSVLAPWVDHERVPYPYRMTFVVTRQCNSRCQMCNIWQQRDLPQLSLEQIEQIFSENDFWFLRSITLTGGEATMRSDLPEIFEIVARHCPNLSQVYLATSALNTKRTIRYVEAMLETAQTALPKLSNFDIQISVDGVGEMHDQIRGIDGFFNILNATIDGLEELQTRFPVLKLYTSTVVMSDNIDSVAELREWSASRGLRSFFSPIVVSGQYYENTQDGDELSVNGQSTTNPIQLFEELAEEEPSALRFHYENIAQMFKGSERTRPCMMGFYDFVLEYNGDIYACVNCETFRFGNLFEESFEQIWFGAKAAEARQKLRATCCPTCPSPCHYPPVSAQELIRHKWSAVQRRLTRSG